MSKYAPLCLLEVKSVIKKLFFFTVIKVSAGTTSPQINNCGEHKIIIMLHIFLVRDFGWNIPDKITINQRQLNSYMSRVQTVCRRLYDSHFFFALQSSALKDWWETSLSRVVGAFCGFKCLLFQQLKISYDLFGSLTFKYFCNSTWWSESI